jgi:hypothetical protein
MAHRCCASARPVSGGAGESSNQTQVRARSRRNPQRCAISLTSWKPRPPSSSPVASRQCGSPVWPSSITSTCTMAPQRLTATVTQSASAAC